MFLFIPPHYFSCDNITSLLLFLLFTEQYEYVNILALAMVANLERNPLISPHPSPPLRHPEIPHLRSPAMCSYKIAVKMFC